MPRTARIKAPNCTYHIIMRGNNRENIFRGDEDKLRYIDTLKRFKIKYDFLLYAYTLMDNHIHLIINSNGEDISKIMQSISISYTYYFNKKYNRCGHLFQDRFKSFIVNGDKYIVNLTKYIHNNPVRAKMVTSAYYYKWSSCKQYISVFKEKNNIVDTDFILKYFSDDEKRAKSLYMKYLIDNKGDLQENRTPQEKIIKPAKPVERNKANEVESINKLLDQVSKYYKVPVEDILLKYNRCNSAVREECIYIVRLKSRQSVKVMAEIFGGVTPSAVSYSINKVVKKIINNEQFFNRISKILKSIA